MANTFTQLHIQFVFAVKNRECIIRESWETELYKYISGILREKKHKLLAINGMPDHIHLFVGLNPKQSISDLMQTVKGSSSKWINEKKFTPGKFSWQSGYGAFSYSHSHLDKVVKYILNQKNHHKVSSFREEYLKMLKSFEVEYKEEYLYDFFEY